MNIKIFNPKTRFFYRTIFLYLLFFTIPILLGSIIYSKAIHTTEDYAKKTNSQFLKQAADVIDSKLMEIDGIAKQISSNPDLRNIINIGDLSEGSKDYYLVSELIINMPKYKLTNQLLYDFYIFLTKSDLVISSNSAYSNTNLHYQRTFGYEGYSFDQWNNLLLKKEYAYIYLPTHTYIINGKKEKLIGYLEPITTYTSTQPRAVLLLLIKENNIRHMLSQIDIGNNGGVFVFNEDNQIITSINGSIFPLTVDEILDYTNISNDSTISKSEQKYLVSTIISKLSNWKYISFTPKTIVLEKVEYIKKITSVIIIFALILAISLAILFSYNTSKLLVDISIKLRELIGKDKYMIKDYSHLKKAIYQIANTQADLQQKIDAQSSLLDASLLRKLLYGEFVPNKDMEAFICTNELTDKTDTPLCVCICNFYFLGIEPDTIWVLLTNVMSQFITYKHFTYNINLKSSAILVMDMNLKKEILSEMVEKLSNKFENDYQMNIVFSFGSIQKGLFNANISYHDAICINELRGFRQFPTIMWFDDIQKEYTNEYYYPIDIESRLINNVKVGNTEEVRNILNLMWNENFEKRQLSISMLKQFTNLVKFTMVRGLHALNINDSIKSIVELMNSTDNLDEIFNYIIRINLEISKSINEQQEFNLLILKNRIIEYIEKNYHLCDLSVTKIASVFEMSESYIYHIIRDKMYITLADYIEQIRMEKARCLLKESDILIKDLAFKVGYINDNSFRRAFKRITGVSPTEYASMYRNKQSY